MLERGTTRPHLFDWNQDGSTDLVVTYPASWEMWVNTSKRPEKGKVLLKPFQLKSIPQVNPVQYHFADWDGDGKTDLLMGMQTLQADRKKWQYGVLWFRNTAKQGEPTFAEPVELLELPEPWELNGIAVTRATANAPAELVVNLTKDWQRKPDVGWVVNSQLWRYKQAAK